MMTEGKIQVKISASLKFHINQPIIVRTTLPVQEKKILIERITYISQIKQQSISFYPARLQTITLIPFDYRLPGHTMISL